MTVSLVAQSQAFTVFGGLTGGNQKWNDGADQSILFRYHGALRIETLNEANENASLFAQVGYHIKGSRQRFRFLFTGGGASNTSVNYEFRNLSLILAAKSKRDYGGPGKLYYYGGIRGDYNLSTNLDEIRQPNQFSSIFFPSDVFVRPIVLGFSGGGGLEMQIRELVGANIEFSIHPDLTLQYRQQALGNVIDPNNPGQVITVPKREIRNITFEVSVGLRLVRKVVYLD
jgi:hypothetical protein